MRDDSLKFSKLSERYSNSGTQKKITLKKKCHQTYHTECMGHQIQPKSLKTESFTFFFNKIK